MNDELAQDDFGVLTEPATLKLQRVLPGPIDRVWSYLTDSKLRGQWLAAGTMEPRAGTKVDLVWRNDELTDPPGNRPDGMPAEHSMTCEVLECDAPNLLRISWGSTGGVTFNLQEQRDRVLLTLTHHRVLDQTMLLNVSAGWHAHLAILSARMRGEIPAPHWDTWTQLKAQYAQRLLNANLVGQE